MDVRLQRCHTTIVLRIEDDGKGFDSTAHTDVDETQGMGLVGMRERATLMRGTLSIDSTPGEGTTVMVSVPLD